jgi:hypothetical protein
VDINHPDQYYTITKEKVDINHPDQYYIITKEKVDIYYPDQYYTITTEKVDINHPDQYYTITKEKEKKLPRFNIESNEYRVTFNELNVQSVPECTRHIENPHSLHGKKLSSLCFLSCLSRFSFPVKRFWHTPQVKVLWCAPLIDSYWQRFVDNIHRNASVKDKCIFTT